MRTSTGFTFVVIAVSVASCGTATQEPVSTPTQTTTPPPVATPPGATTVPSTSTSTATTVAEVVIADFVEVDGTRLWFECRGSGSPTVIFESGLGSDSRVWTGILADVSPTTRACRYDRAGLGKSWDVSDPGTITVAGSADQLLDLLRVAGIEGPYVGVGWSYGGMITRDFAARNLDEIAGLVFVDSSHEDQFTDPFWLTLQPEWTDGPYEIDLEQSRTQLMADTDLGAVPTIVLTNGAATGDFESHWMPLQDALASMSSNSLHMIAIDSGHAIPDDRPDLVIASVEAVIAAARAGEAIGECDARFPDAECLGIG